MPHSADPGERHHLHWETVLDRLELDLILSERKLTDPDAPDPEPWAEPQLAGPMPSDLAARARDLQARQAALRDRLTLAALSLRRHQDFTARVDRATARTARPVYLDVEA